MSLEIREREIEGIAILDLDGRLTAGEETASFRDFVQTRCTAGPYRAVVNLHNVEFIDSTGLGGLVISYTAAKRSGGALKLVHLKEREVELLVLTKLNTVFEIFRDEQDAVNSFFPGRKLERFDILSFVQSQKND
jgi:anti-sigma B factor antagonist